MESKKKTIIRILPSFHYDVAYRETFKSYLPRSFTAIDEGLKLLEKHKDFVFSIEQVILLREYWNKHPGKRDVLKKFAAEKRLLASPGMFTMPDSNIPSGENFIRNALIGRHWLKKHLNITPECCWMADVFGHNPQSPQLAGTCGFSSYMFERGKAGSWNTSFLWEGIDGTAIPAHWEIDTYFGINLALNLMTKGMPYEWARKCLDREIIEKLKTHSPTERHLLSTMGGDFDIPDESRLEAISRLKHDFPDMEFVFSAPEAYFSALKEEGVKLETEKIDLNPLFEGCNSSRIRLKLYNRKLEERAASIELMETMSAVPHRVSEKLWEDICWNAFHDIICGTLEHNAYCQALKKYKTADEKSGNFLRQLLLEYAYNALDVSGKGKVLFNSLPYPREEVIEMPRAGGAKSFVKANIPASGLLFVKDSSDSGSKGSVKIRKKGYVLENGLLRVRLGINGTIESFFDKEHGNELADSTKGMNNPVIRSDMGDLWALDARPVNPSLLRTAPYKNPSLPAGGGIQREGRTALTYSSADTCYESPSLEIVDNHPLQCTVQITYEELRFQTRLTLRHGEKLLRFTSRYVPAGKRYRLGVVFPSSITGGRVRHSVPFGHIERPEGEYAVQGWIDYSDSVKGLLLLNKGLPGNNVTDNVMMLSLFRGVAMEDSDKKPWHEEGVEHVFEYALMPFKPGDKSYNPARKASLFNREVECAETAQSSKPRNPAANSGSVPFIRLSGAQAEVSCIKRKGKSLIVRLWESSGRHGDISLALRETMSACLRTDAALTYFQKVGLKENNITLSLKPFEIITLKIVLQ